MYFVALCTDKPNTNALRMGTRDAHLAFLERHADKVTLGGPFLDADGATMTGSMLLLNCATEVEARALLSEDPYGKAGLFASVELKPWRWTFKPPA